MKRLSRYLIVPLVLGSFLVGCENNNYSLTEKDFKSSAWRPFNNKNNKLKDCYLKEGLTYSDENFNIYKEQVLERSKKELGVLDLNEDVLIPDINSDGYVGPD